MKIAMLAIGGFDRSGTDRVIPCLLWLVEHLTRSGHEVHVFVPRQEDQPGAWPLLGASVHNAGRGTWRLRMLRSIAQEHRRRRFDVIHACWSSMGLVGALASRLLRVPMLLTLPGGDVLSLPSIGYGGMLSLRGRAELRISAAAARQVTVPSRYMRDLAAGLGIDAVTVPLGVDIQRWAPAPPRTRNTSSPLRLIHVASLNRVKDQPTLLRAMRILKAREVAFELRMIGCDTLAGETQRLAARLGLGEQVRFMGEMKHAHLRKHYEWADLLVMSSLHEAGPLVMLEGALAGLPTVGTRVGHMADCSPEGALAVPAGNPRALAEAIRTISSDEAKRLNLARSAQRFAVEHDAAFTASRFVSLYGDAINAS